jgi:hypothetical protein
MTDTDLRTAATHQVLSLRDRLGQAPSEGSMRRGEVSIEELRRVFGAPWTSLGLVAHDAGTVSEPRKLTDSDLLVFVVAGEGRAECTSGPVELTPGTSVAILKGEEFSIVAHGGADLELFYAEMALPE